MKILLLTFALLAFAIAGTQMIEVSGFKTADQLLNDVQDDLNSVFGIVFFKRDDTNFELTQSNKDILEGLRRVADKKALKITDANIKYLFFSRVDMSVPENKRLWERFGLNENSCNQYPVAVTMRGAKGTKIEGPAVISLFANNIEKVAGLTQTAAAPTAADLAKFTVQADCEKAGGKWDAAGKKCVPK